MCRVGIRHFFSFLQRSLRLRLAHGGFPVGRATRSARNAASSPWPLRMFVFSVLSVFFFVFFSCCASLWGEEFLLPASIPHSSMDRVFEGSVCQRGSVALVCIYMCECVCACVSITLHTRQKHKRQESYSGSSSSWVTFQDATGNLCRYVPEANHHSST